MTEEEQIQKEAPVAPAPETAKKKKSLISIPFLLIVPILGVAGYFGAKQIMYMTMLNDLKNEAAKPTVIGESGNRSVEQESAGSLPGQ